MARTVAEIDGDSSGLVGELGKAKKAMGDLGSEGKKLTDQLRQVADEADVAAGNLISKLGGPSAIKAIGGIGLAFEGASRLAGAFLDSSEALFRSYGDEGQKVWDNTEKSLFAIKGAFAEAVLGGGSVEEMGGRLKTIFEGVKLALDALLLPVKGLSALVRGLAGDFTELSGQVVEASDKLDQLASKTRMEGLTKNAEGIEGLRLRIMQLRGETEALRQVEIQRDIAAAERIKNDILANELQSDALQSAAVVVGAQAEIEKKAAEKQQEYIRSLGEEKLSHAQLAEARRIYNAEMLAQGQALMAQQLKQREGVSAANQAQLDEVNQQIATFKELAAAKVEPAKTGGGTAGGKKPEEKVDGMEAEQRARNEMAAILNANDKMEQQLTMDKLKALDDRINAETERKKAAIDAVNEYALEMERQHDAELHAQGKLTVKEQEELDKARLEQAKSYLADYTTAFMQSQGRQLAIGKLSAKEAGDFARKQLGNAIMGLGDKAMAEAGIMAASLNPLAIPMAAAGVAAYAVGSALNADKKQVATEPPTEVAGAQAQPASYSFNLQVDSVFADGESVARQFARMQESARQRGLLTQGAY